MVHRTDSGFDGSSGHPRSVHVTMVHGYSDSGFDGSSGHPGIVPECLSNYGTRDTQTVCIHTSSSSTSRYSPGVSM